MRRDGKELIANADGLLGGLEKHAVLLALSARGDIAYRGEP